MKKISMLIGAGAEIDLGLSGGQDFARYLLSVRQETTNSDKTSELNQKLDDMNNAISEHYKELKIDWYPTFRHGKFKVSKFQESCLKKKMLLLNDDFENKKDFEKEIHNDLEKMSDKEKNELMNGYPSYMGIIDEYFHTFINPKYLGPDKFWWTVGVFNRAYILMVDQITGGKMTYNEILRNPKSTIECIQNDALIKFKKQECYYSIIKSLYKENKDLLTGIITTNYTPFCKLIDESIEVSYLHGQLGMFESAKELKVFEVGALDQVNAIIKNKSDILFPYLSVQSGIKPIICTSQVKEYAKMLNILYNSDIIIILGYEFNVDDNHINGIIKEWLLKDKNKLIFLKYVETEKDSNAEKHISKKKLKKIFSLDDSEFLERIRIEILSEENSLTDFSNLLNSCYFYG